MTTCTGCGASTRHMPDWEAELVEAHDMCRGCRTTDLDQRLRDIKTEIREAADDLGHVAGHVPDDLEADLGLLVDTVAAINARRAA